MFYTRKKEKQKEKKKYNENQKTIENLYTFLCLCLHLHLFLLFDFCAKEERNFFYLNLFFSGFFFSSYSVHKRWLFNNLLKWRLFCCSWNFVFFFFCFVFMLPIRLTVWQFVNLIISNTSSSYTATIHPYNKLSWVKCYFIGK